MLALLGPTAAGKSEAAVLLALGIRAEIVSADSVQVYRGLDVGTAKPTIAQRRGVPHHLIDVVDPGQEMTVAQFADLAHAAIEDVLGRGRRPLVSGGTGLYLRAALGEWQVTRLEPDRALRAEWRQRVSEEGPAALWQEVARRYPERAAAIGVADIPRLLRVLEVGGRQGTAQASPYRLLKVGWWRRRQEIADRIAERAEQLWQGGMVEETARLMALGLSRELPPLGSLGYREAAAFLAGEMSRQAAIAAFLTRSRHLAKRQMTWWRREGDIFWIHAEEEGMARLQAVSAVFLTGNDPRAVFGPDPYQPPAY